jgi:hypothetical protein
MKGITGSIAETIEEYRNSKRKLIGRIQELNIAIGRRKTGGEVKELAERRHRLYLMTYDLDLALRLMGEYAPAANAYERKGLKNAG